MRRYRLGAWFIMLDRDEVIPAGSDIKISSTRIIRPRGGGFEILRCSDGKSLIRQPEMIFETEIAALRWGYEDYCNE